eukprot:TRINITY_DN1979_c0_g1_i5.p1 TRINITY_DN1979_c0_g1~~TRINITY_DN1979_c0_g1_i5.p1  ORF type:complete len:176 (+),score=24.30 TRINITY_DN1979_c0_g1_i5:360-887(+)
MDDRKSLEGMKAKELRYYTDLKKINVTTSDAPGIVDRIFSHSFRASGYSFSDKDLPSPSPEILPTTFDITDLSISSLKLVLQNNGVDYRHCIEKKELIELVRKSCPNVIAATTKTELFGIPDDEQCIICYNHRIDTVLLECGHLATCKECSTGLAFCPICRRGISRMVQVFHANK